MPVLTRADSYEALIDGFAWAIPERLNIAELCCGRWAKEAPERVAVLQPRPDGTPQPTTFAEIEEDASRIAHVLVAAGVKPGDRVGVFLPQSVEALSGYLAALKVGAILMPLAPIFMTEAVHYRLSHAGAKVLITDAAGAEKVAPIAHQLTSLELVASVDGATAGATDLTAAMAQQPDHFATVDTAASDPALLYYAAAGAGDPNGTLLAHSVIHGSMSGVEMGLDFPTEDGDDVFWTPADWGFIAGSLCVLFPALMLGRPIVANRAQGFKADATFQLLQDFAVTCTFLPPTASKVLREDPELGKHYALKVRAIISGGEPFTPELQGWSQAVFGCKMNDYYGQTECNAAVITNHSLMEAKPFKLGKPAPGRTVAVLSVDGTPMPVGETGLIAIKAPDPVMMLEYWNDPEATAEKIKDGWLYTGDYGVQHEDGYFSWAGRVDDVITSAGYRIGPAEIERHLKTHPAVADAAVFGVPDEKRTEIVGAWIVLAEGASGDQATEAAIRDHVKARLGAHEYPRVIRFVDDYPRLAGGPDRKQIQKQHGQGG